MSAGERDDFLSRWSRRKLASKAGPARPTADAIPAKAGIPAPAPGATPSTASAAVPPEPAPLPPVESLTPESDFTPFMQSKVDPGLRRQALRTLFRDPRFNVMDGLDVYIDDYSKPDPIPAEWLGKLNQMARLGDYRPPEEENPQAEGADAHAKAEEITPCEQGINEPAAPPASDTSAAGPPPPETTQS